MQLHTEHGAETSNAIDVVIEVYLSITVTVAQNKRVERRIANSHTCKKILVNRTPNRPTFVTSYADSMRYISVSGM